MNWILLLLYAAFVFCLGGWTGASQAEKNWKEEAVNRGKAEFYMDENHKRQWRWKP